MRRRDDIKESEGSGIRPFIIGSRSIDVRHRASLGNYLCCHLAFLFKAAFEKAAVENAARIKRLCERQSASRSRLGFGVVGSQVRLRGKMFGQTKLGAIVRVDECSHIESVSLGEIRFVRRHRDLEP